MEQAVVTQDWGTTLRIHGLRATQPRIAVMEALWHNPHSSAEQIALNAQQHASGLSLQSVYNVLSDLGARRLVRSLELPHQPGLFELDNHDNHHHAVCTACGAVVDVACAVGHSPCLVPSDEHDMVIEVADVLYRGLCADCRATLHQTQNTTTRQPNRR